MRRFTDMSLFDRLLGKSNESPPTNLQLTVARQLGVEVKGGMSMDDVSELIRRAKSEHASRTNNDGKTGELDSDAHRLPTACQLAEARAFDVIVNDEMSYAEVDALIRQAREAESTRPPNAAQIELCRIFGLQIKPGMTRPQLEQLLENSPEVQAVLQAAGEGDRPQQRPK